MAEQSLSPAEVAALFDRSRLLVARTMRGLDKTALAREMGGAVTAASLSQFEQGHSRPSPSTLSRMAVALRVPLHFFAAPRHSAPMASLDGYFRSLRSTTPRDRQRALAYVALIREFVMELEKVVTLPSLNIPEVMPRRPAPAEFQPDTIEAVASAVRTSWNVPGGPIKDVVRLLERHGVVVVRFEAALPKVDAFSVPFPDRPVVALCADKGWRDRSRFDAAHELGHLVMHEPSQVGSKVIERQADQFAASFLMPRKDIQDQLPTTADWPRFLQLKSEWHVSMAALLVRSKTLGVMDDATQLRAWKTLSAKGWRRAEPGYLGPAEEPTLLRRAVSVASDHGNSIEKLADRSGLPIDDIEKLIGGPIHPKPLVDLQ